MPLTKHFIKNLKHQRCRQQKSWMTQPLLLIGRNKQRNVFQQAFGSRRFVTYLAIHLHWMKSGGVCKEATGRDELQIVALQQTRKVRGISW